MDFTEDRWFIHFPRDSGGEGTCSCVSWQDSRLWSLSWITMPVLSPGWSCQEALSGPPADCTFYIRLTRVSLWLAVFFPHCKLHEWRERDWLCSPLYLWYKRTSLRVSWMEDDINTKGLRAWWSQVCIKWGLFLREIRGCPPPHPRRQKHISLTFTPLTPHTSPDFTTHLQ